MPKLVSLNFSCPDPSIERDIVIISKDGSLVRCHYFEKCNGVSFWASNENYIDLVIPPECKGFVNGGIKWIYKKDLMKSFDLFAKSNIIKEEDMI